MMAFLRSVAYVLALTVVMIPAATLIVLLRLLGTSPSVLYSIARFWLAYTIDVARVVFGIRYRIQGQENLPTGETSAAILLVKHQSTYETFLMPAIMPHPLAYVFKKELLRIPFFGWAIGSLDMIHIDRSQRSQAFTKVATQGQVLLDKGVWVIMFPEGTRIARGERGVYKSGGARLAIATGAPVIPIAVTSAKCWPRKTLLTRPGMVDVSIGQAIASQGREPEELMREVETWIEAEMQRLDPEAYPQAHPEASPAIAP